MKTGLRSLIELNDLISYLPVWKPCISDGALALNYTTSQALIFKGQTTDFLHYGFIVTRGPVPLQYFVPTAQCDRKKIAKCL